jgi:hypothetical protein
MVSVKQINGIEGDEEILADIVEGDILADQVPEFQEIEKKQEEENLGHRVWASDKENRINDGDFNPFDEEYFEK